MDQEEARISQKPAWRMDWRRMAKLGLTWLGAILLGALVWVDTQNTAEAQRSHLGALLVLIIAHILLVVVLERGLAYTPLKRAWRYRLAFLASAALPLIQGLTGGLISLLFPFQATGASLSPVSLALRLVMAPLAAFAGGLLATRIDEGLWENNSPPLESLQAEVYRCHLEQIGEVAPVAWTKRGFDLCLALTGIVLSAPVWIASAFMIWFEDPGPLFFVKNSVGMGGVNFRQLKFRTMVRGAEENTGPVLSEEGDQRILAFGRILRKTALDELPQLLNILRGEMSFVGPRPQRTVLVHGYLQEMPEYAQRHAALPGLAGLAQVAGDYYLTPRQKLRFDRLYIQHASLGFDLKLILLAFLITFWYRWQKGWNGRLPRTLLRWGSSRRAVTPARGSGA